MYTEVIPTVGVNVYPKPAFVIPLGPNTASEITAVAIFRISKSKSLQTDFAQRKITVLKNDLQVKAIAGTTAGVHTLLTKLIAKSGPRPTWVEVHAENSHVQDVILKLGFSAVATKVSASSDIKTLYVKNVNETQRVSGSLFESDIPALKLLGKGADVETVQQCLKERNKHLKNIEGKEND